MKKIKDKQIVDAPSETFDYEGFEKEALGHLKGDCQQFLLRSSIKGLEFWGIAQSP
jgi:hypothetical protein